MKTRKLIFILTGLLATSAHADLRVLQVSAVGDCVQRTITAADPERAGCKFELPVKHQYRTPDQASFGVIDLPPEPIFFYSQIKMVAESCGEAKALCERAKMAAKMQILGASGPLDVSVDKGKRVTGAQVAGPP